MFTLCSKMIVQYVISVVYWKRDIDNIKKGVKLNENQE